MANEEKQNLKLKEFEEYNKIRYSAWKEYEEKRDSSYEEYQKKYMQNDKGHEAPKAEGEHEEPSMPKELPIITFKGKATEYYWDARMLQVRNVRDPLDYWDPDHDVVNSIEYMVERGTFAMPFRYKED